VHASTRKLNYPNCDHLSRRPIAVDSVSIAHCVNYFAHFSNRFGKKYAAVSHAAPFYLGGDQATA